VKQLAKEQHENRGHWERDAIKIALTDRIYSAGLDASILEAIVKVVLKGYQIQRALASARTLCPFPEYSPLFQNTILIVSEDPDG
jgi:hypothetical protein